MSKHPEASAPINVLLMFREHVIPRYRELQGELVRLAKREQDIRAEISRIERHAAIEGITLATTEEPDAPKLLSPPAPETPAV